MTPGEVQFKLTYEISPIFLTGGIAGSMPGATVPIISYTDGNLFGSILAAGQEQALDNFFAHFIPVAGSTLVNNAIGKYPLANQSVAANALIFEPLRISLVMICPARREGDFRQRQAIITSLKRTLDAHHLAGGTYTIATPTFLYTDCVMTGFSDASGGETRQPQYRYQLDFEQPLISQQAAQQSYNNLMAKIGSQTQLTPDANGEIGWSNTGNTVGNPESGAAPEIVPPNQTDPGLGFAPSSTTSSTAADAASGFTPPSEFGSAFEGQGGVETAVASTNPTPAPTSPAPAGTAINDASSMNIPTTTTFFF